MAYPMIETGMICLGESDDKLAGPLVTGVDIDAGFPQPLRIHQRHQLEQQVRLRLEQVRGFFLYSRFELLRRRAGNAVPRLSLAPVHCENSMRKKSGRIGAETLTVVDTVCVMILEQILSAFDR